MPRKTGDAAEARRARAIRRGASTRALWANATPEAREARRARAIRRGASTRALWANATPEAREEMKRRSWAGYAEKHPDRAALVEQTWAAIQTGTITRQPCDHCGLDAKPLFDWSSLTLAGWRCLACRKALES